MSSRCLLAYLAFTMVARSIGANPLDTFGHTSRVIALGGAGTASSDSYDSCYYNPAALGMLKQPELGFGLQVFRPFLTAEIHDLDEATGHLVAKQQERAAETRLLFDVGFASPIPLGQGLERVLFAGVGVTLPGTTLYAIRDLPRAEPYFPFLEDRNRRLVLNGAFAIRPFAELMVGAGFSLLPDVLGDVVVDFTKSGSSNAASVDVEMHLSANAGVLVKPIEQLSLGLVWRGANRTYLSIPVRVKLSEQIAQYNIEVLAYDYSTPHEVAFGASWKGDSWLVTGDFTYYFYRDFHQSAPAVNQLDSKGNVIGSIEVADPNFHDTVAIRLGGEWEPIESLALRLGFGWVQSPVPPQSGETNLLDGDRFIVSAGVGYDFIGFDVPIVIDGHIFWSGMISNRDEKLSPLPGNPGYPWVGGSGSILNAGLTARVRFR